MVFKEIYDVWTKEVLLRKAFEKTLKMMDKDKEAFSLAYNALIKNIDEHIEKVVKDEDRVDKYMQDVRREILEYLAVNSAPDVAASLILTTVIISLERIGDYSEDMTKLAVRYPKKVSEKKYLEAFDSIYERIIKLFDMTKKAFADSDEEVAKEAIALYMSIKKDCNTLYDKLEKEKRMEPRTAMIYALLTRYLQRVGAHLNNINTTVVNPFPLAGSKKAVKRVE
ncbi:MAG: phosphate uptake regulator PhoU [Candidatus Diapherotrites archaeon]|nr:phosphate uptake regulator PhoU [Candidatus Diapherotrites archaeon]